MPNATFALRFISGKYQGGEFPLRMDREIVVGRSSDLDMVLVEDMVSRKHAKIAASGDQIVIQDLGSTNGTFVNGEKIKKARLKEGDRILIGTSIIKLIAVDITKRRLLVLPDDLVFYREPKRSALIDPDSFKIARAARMSMSIPYFFDPIQLEDQDGTTCYVVDGGTLSNFPVWLFDVDPSVTGRPPSRPTFGFTLEHGRGLGGGLTSLQHVEPWAIRFGFDIFHTAQEAWDARFVSHSTRVRTVTVDAADVATTEFNLSKEKQELLIANGRAAAKTFLDQFDLDGYLNTFHAQLAPVAAAAGGSL